MVVEVSSGWVVINYLLALDVIQSFLNGNQFIKVNENNLPFTPDNANACIEGIYYQGGSVAKPDLAIEVMPGLTKWFMSFQAQGAIHNLDDFMEQIRVLLESNKLLAK